MVLLLDQMDFLGRAEGEAKWDNLLAGRGAVLKAGLSLGFLADDDNGGYLQVQAHHWVLNLNGIRTTWVVTGSEQNSTVGLNSLSTWESCMRLQE